MTAPSETRAHLLDVVRAVALIGIAVVNVEYLFGAFDSGYLAAQMAEPVDAFVAACVTALAAGKFYVLFSFAFGASFGFQSASSDPNGVHSRHIRRTWGLLALGALHAVFAFFGDILMVYAILGAILFSQRNRSPRELVRIALIVLAVWAVLACALFLTVGGLASTETGEDNPLAFISALLASGDFWQASFARLLIAAFYQPFGLVLQGPAAFAFMCLGLAAMKSGVLSDLSHPLWARLRLYGFGLGLPIAAATGFVAYRAALGGDTELAYAMDGLGLLVGGVLSAGYLGGLAAITAKGGAVARFFRRAGRNALSVYLLTSAVLAFLAYGYGFGMGETKAAGAAIGIAVAVAFGLAILAAVWEKAIGYGPFEFVLRRLVRGPGQRRRID